MRWLIYTLGVLLLALLGWQLLGQHVIEPLIERAHRGEGAAFVRGLMPAREARPLERYLTEWRHISRLGSLALVMFWGLLQIPRTYILRCIGEATPGTVGAIRMLVFALMLASTLWEDLASIVYLPDEMRSHTTASIGLIHLLRQVVPGFDALHDSQTGLTVFKYAVATCLFFGMIGFKTRLFVPLGALGYLLVGGMLRQYCRLYHTGLTPLYLGLALSFMPCGDGWSLDRLLRVARGRPVPDADTARPSYGLCRYLLWMLVALPYVAAGLSKLRIGGLMWWDADNIRHYLYHDSLNAMHFDFSWALHLRAAPDILFAMIGLAALIGELGYGLVLFSRWARVVFPMLMAGMHTGILFLQNILFFDMIPLQAIFFDWRAIRKWIGRRLAASRGLLDVLYDGHCALCRRTVAILRGADLFERLRFVDFRQADLVAFNAGHGTTISADDLERQMYFVGRGGVAAGFDGYRRMAVSVPLFWPLVPLLFVPGVASLGQRAYDWVARNRKLLVCDESCALDGGPAPMAPAPDHRYPRWALPLCVAVAGLIAACWLSRMDKYPLTAMRMYEDRNTDGVLTYRKAFAHYDNGAVEEARFDRWIGAMADTRYRGMLQRALADRPGPHQQFFAACINRANRNAPEGRTIEFFEIQQITWDYKNDIDNPNFGNVEKTYRYPPIPVETALEPDCDPGNLLDGVLTKSQ
jgi:predicted DCC family thiol-disulfide oxidoreductase YuxK